MNIKYCSKFLAVSFLIFSQANAQNPKQSLIDVGNITTWVANNGFHDWVVDSSNWNGAYPNGVNAGVIFSEGILWGGLVNDGQLPLVRVNGNNYGSGCSPITRLYRVRYDYSTADLTLDAADFFNKDISQVSTEDIDEIKTQYKKDWDEWPANKGAPFYDKNKDGKYEPGIDIPGVPGAVQTIWIDYNDSLSNELYGSQPIGLEIQETYWGYYPTDSLGNFIFKKVDIIYKGLPFSPPNAKIDSMYIVQWSDTDIGYGVDDFAGCDTTLNLGFAYNAGNLDKIYSNFGLIPPAVGYSFIQGVSENTGNPNDSAIFNFKWKKGRKYVNRKNLSSFIYFGSGATWADPDFSPNGKLQFYNLMRGYLPRPSYPAAITFPSSVADYTSNGVYLLDGNPLTQTGKIDGNVDGPGDRRIMMVTGPFNLKLGDTAEVVIALAGGIGNNHLASVSYMKQNASYASLLFNAFVSAMTSGQVLTPNNPPHQKIPEGPNNYILRQNYPNPFNSATVISYSLAKSAHVKLIVYDVLGRIVKTLVDEYKVAGNYEAVFNAESLPSGVYFYKISFDNEDNKLASDKLYKVKKMILLK